MDFSHTCGVNRLHNLLLAGEKGLRQVQEAWSGVLSSSGGLFHTKREHTDSPTANRSDRIGELQQGSQTRGWLAGVRRPLGSTLGGAA